ncbi:MAG: hypothetical protein IT368_14080 [Candidatus Hydrogenedentes bacterium]|nr:hypothetical protein [Candidatus Hydrogenedentota bacterium]
MKKLVKGVALTGMAVLALLSVAAIFSGCFGERLPLPPVTLTISVTEDEVLGPGAGLPAGTTLNNTLLARELTCNLPTMDDLRDRIRAEVGEVAAGFIEIEAIKVKRASLIPSQGSFNTLTMMALNGIAVGIEGFAPIAIGSANSLQGFNGPVDIYPNNVDVLPLFEVGEPGCGAIVLHASGVSPNEDVIFDGEVVVEVYFSIGL